MTDPQGRAPRPAEDELSTQVRDLLAIEELSPDEADALRREIEKDPALSSYIEGDPDLDPLFLPDDRTGRATVDLADDVPSPMEWRSVDTAIWREIGRSAGGETQQAPATPTPASSPTAAPTTSRPAWMSLAATLVVGIGLGMLGLSAIPDPSDSDALRASLAIPEAEDLPDDAQDWNINVDEDAVMIRISTD